MAKPIGKQVVTKKKLALRPSHNRGCKKRNFSVSAIEAVFIPTTFDVSESPESFRKLDNLSGNFRTLIQTLILSCKTMTKSLVLLNTVAAVRTV